MSRKDLFFHLRILHLHRTMQTSRFVYRSNGKTNIRRLLQRTVEGAGFKKTLCETAQIVHGETGYAVVDLRAGWVSPCAAASIRAANHCQNR